MSVLADLPAARAALRGGTLTALELVRATLERAEALEPTIGAFAELTPELALKQAERADADLRAGRDRGPLHGLPLAVKDVIDVAGVPTRLGTPAAGHRVPAASAAVVEAAVEAGAVVIGKATTHELAFGMLTPQSRNPFDPSRIVGGSSGGSASAVAAGLAAIALGTDTNGSVRCPAALCGVVGLKPALGSVPRAGVAPLAWSQDTVGALAPTVADCAAAYSVLAPGAATPALAPRAATLRLGVDRAACASASPAVEGACLAALEELGGRGAEIVDVSLPDLTLAGSASIVVLIAEAAAAWREQLAAQPEGFGPTVRGALLAGREVSAGAYLRAKRVRAHVCRQVRELFDGLRLDALALPTVPVTAAPAGASTGTLDGRERALDAALSRFTALASLTGQPALSVPCGLDADGLPIGLQLLGRSHEEGALLSAGAAFEATQGARAVTSARGELPA